MKNDDNTNNEKDLNSKNENANNKISTNINIISVLDTNGLKTPGLTGKKNAQLKTCKDYNPKIQDNINNALAHEKERTKQIIALLNSLHPGYIVPKNTIFNGLILSKKDLERTNFTECLLRNVKLRECKLRGAIFKNSDLSGVDLRKSDLTDVIFDNCNLGGADIRHCNLTNARIIDSNLFASNFDNSTLDNSVIDTCSMGAQSFYNSSCKGIRLYNSQILHGFFDSTDMSGADIKNMLFKDCTLTNTCFDKATLEECSFRSCESFQEGPVFSNVLMRNVKIIDCDLEEANLEDAHIFNSIIERVTMKSALLDGACFNEVFFDEGIMQDCYSVENAPVFTKCNIQNLTIDRSDLTNASFNNSSFIGATIIDSDFDKWEMTNTKLDENTSINSSH